MYGITTVLECSAALHTNIDYLRKVIITQGSEIETIRLNVAVDPYTWRSEAEAVRRRRKDAIKAHEQVEEMIKAREEAVAKERERIQKEQERIARIRAKRRQTGDVAARQREALEKSWGVTPLVRRVASKVTLDLESCGRFYKLFRGLETITLTTFKSILHWLGHPAWAGDVVSARIVAVSTQLYHSLSPAFNLTLHIYYIYYMLPLIIALYCFPFLYVSIYVRVCRLLEVV